MTPPVPATSERGRFRFGFLTSPAVNVMLFQASAAKSDPTCATQSAMKRPKKLSVAETVGRNEKSG